MKFSATRSADSSARAWPVTKRMGSPVSHAHAVLVLDADRDLRVEQPERLEAERNAADDSVLTRDEARARAPVRHDSRDRRDVVERAVFD